MSLSGVLKMIQENTEKKISTTNNNIFMMIQTTENIKLNFIHDLKSYSTNKTYYTKTYINL